MVLPANDKRMAVDLRMKWKEAQVAVRLVDDAGRLMPLGDPTEKAFAALAQNPILDETYFVSRPNIRSGHSHGGMVGLIEAYEQGRRKPDQVTIALLRVIEREPDAVRRALAS